METDKTKQDKFQKGKEQLQKSSGIIDLKTRNTYEDITNIKVKNERLEKERRDLEEIERQQRFNLIQKEAIEGSKQNAALEMRWPELKEEEEAETLSKKIDEQKSHFYQIISSKDNLIKMFQDTLLKKDEAYVKMLKDQKQDIDDMLARMRKQFYDLRALYLAELEQIEVEFLLDRENLLRSNKNDIQKLLDAHEELEKKIVYDRDIREEQFARDIDKLRIDNSKNYTDTKISMEIEIQNLEKCLEDMKALYLLNSEKLEYNLKVLKEKDDENKQLGQILKAKLMNHKTRHSKLLKEFTDADKNFKQENKALTHEYKRITKQFKELQRKFKHFEKADLDRYDEIQDMNKAEIEELKQKIIKCDTTIHIQQLGMIWNPPKEDDEEELNPTNERSKNGSEVKKEDEEDFQFNLPTDEIDQLVSLLLKETDFLLDDKTREQLADKLTKEQLQMKLDVIKKCLYIDSIEEMNMLFEELSEKIKVAERPIEMGENNENAEEHEQIQEQVKYVSDPDKVIDVVQGFIGNKDQRKALLNTNPRKVIKIETEKEKKERLAKEGKKYWEKLTHVLPDHTFRVWQVLDKALAKYYDLLLERQKLIEETGDLHNQNEELKNLLDQYFQINHELIIPPTKMMQIENA